MLIDKSDGQLKRKGKYQIRLSNYGKLIQHFDVIKQIRIVIWGE
jgi:hypothetical protein